ncbi:MAG: tRNA (adenosine(37)-N6)-threonylcarbamoyltransferase complex dimerization subunit type 1 TsaB [Acutalibacteraceae bacterium]
MKILAIDSTASPASAALLEDDKILGEFFINTSLTHSVTLMPMCEALLKNTSTDINDIDLFAVNAGPGSFTGVRIGVSAVKGMAWNTNKPCASVSTLYSAALNLKNINCIACAVMDARCRQFYNALFKCEENGKVTRLCNDRAISFEELAADLKKYSDSRIILTGDGSDLAYSLLSPLVNNIEAAPEHLKYQRASGTAFAAKEMLINNDTLSAKELMPIYLRLPQAERELKKRQGENSK